MYIDQIIAVIDHTENHIATNINGTDTTAVKTVKVMINIAVITTDTAKEISICSE
jgi:hypothetical protein